MSAEAGTRRIPLGSHALRCAVSGSGDPLFFCLHGLVDRLEIWDLLAQRLARHGRVARMDQRGHGGSDTPPGPYTRDDLVGDVVGVLDALEAERAILVGHSMGGIVSMATSLAHPDRVAGLVLLGTASQCSEKVAGWYERIATAGEREGLAGLARSIYGEGRGRAIEGDAQGIAHVTRTLKSLHEDPLTPRLSQIRCPVLLLVGSCDPMGPKASEIIRSALPEGRGRLEVVPERGHWLHVEGPDEVAATILDWLANPEGEDR